MLQIDLLALVEQDGFRTVRKSTSREGQRNGPCPWCGGHDRFRVQPNYGTYGFFACNQCRRSGSAVDYLMLKRGFPKWKALTAAGWKPKGMNASQLLVPGYAYEESPQWREPSVQWQEAATDFYRRRQRLLWSRDGQGALDYLRRRNLKDGTIRRAMLGYHPQEEFGSASEWGKPVRLFRGIVFPWLIGGKVWRLTVRDETVAEGDSRYRQVAGGSNGLYLADSLTLKRRAAVVTEGEIDALSLAQECGDLVAVVATGTTQGSHTPRWVAMLAAQERVLIAFDAEVKGDAAAAWWLKRMVNARRLRPLWRDVNQMLQDGADLRAWLTSAGLVDGAEVPRRSSYIGAGGNAVGHSNNEGCAFAKEDRQPPTRIESGEERSSFKPGEVPEPYKRFREAHSRLGLPGGIPLRVSTPQGKGDLWQVWTTRIGVVLDSDPGRVTFFNQLEDIQAIQPLAEEEWY